MELIWTLSGFVVVILTLTNLIQVSKQMALTPFAHDGERLIYLIAWGYVRREVIRLAQALGVLVIGLVAMVQDSPAGVNKTTILGLILTTVLFLICLGIGLQSQLDRNQRQDIEDILREERKKT